MSRSIIGKCALCHRDNIKLMQSHIIPKLVYSRTKSYKNSRFRNYLDFYKIFQDGEKKPMLCNDCEEHFSKFEVDFTNKFLDKYLHSNKKTFRLMYDGIQDYIISVAWRILYDELFVYGSFKDTFQRNTFEELERMLRKYLNEIRKDGIEISSGISNVNFDSSSLLEEMTPLSGKDKKGIMTKTLKDIYYNIFTLKQLGYPDDIIELLDTCIFGYCFYTKDLRNYIIFTVYKGLVIVVNYYDRKNIYLYYNVKDYINSFRKKHKLKEALKNEINYEIEQMKKAYSKNDEILNKNNLKEKLEKRYSNAEKQK